MYNIFTHYSVGIRILVIYRLAKSIFSHIPDHDEQSLWEVGKVVVDCNLGLFHLINGCSPNVTKHLANQSVWEGNRVCAIISYVTLQPGYPQNKTLIILLCKTWMPLCRFHLCEALHLQPITLKMRG